MSLNREHILHVVQTALEVLHLGITKHQLAVIADRITSQLSAPALPAEVLRGLQLLREHLDEGGHDWRQGTAMGDVQAARAWLDQSR